MNDDLFGSTLPPRVSSPFAREVQLCLTAMTPISHHDPARQDKSNTLLFLRHKQIVPSAFTTADPEAIQNALKDISELHRVPESAARLFTGIKGQEFVGCLLVKLFIGLYGTGDGTGLFSGVERYGLLETRLRAAAVRSSCLRSLWNRLVDSLQCPIAPAKADVDLLELFSLPIALQAATLRALTEDYRSITMLARLWAQEWKMQDERYAETAGRATSGALVAIALSAESVLSAAKGSSVIEMPAVSNNSLRHQLVRGPGWHHLTAALELPVGFAGEGIIPVGAEGTFENGGNIRAGAKQPSDPFGLAHEVRRSHPLLDLLGGVTDSFDLGESKLKVAGWLVCRENAAALAGTPVSGDATVSAFDLLDEQVHTRMATERGDGQMIYNFETLIPGTKVFVRLHVSPFTSQLTLGALGAALTRFQADGAVLGGQSARGYGWMQAELLTTNSELIEAQAAYEAYLNENKEALVEGLKNGTLGARAKVCS